MLQYLGSFALLWGFFLCHINAFSNNGYLEELNSLPISDNSKIKQRVDVDLNEVAASTPEDHYAKKHPGAGWAGFKHPQFGGYLDNLSTVVTRDE